jgi:two-component system, LuxR family, sensor kinase FixL
MMSEIPPESFKILPNILHGVIITDSRGHILFMNQACEKILGYKMDEISGKHIQMLYGDEEMMPFKQIMDECIKGNDLFGRWHAVHKNGKKVWLDVRARLLPDKTGDQNICLISLCDIGKLKFTEKRLKKSMAVSDAIFDTSLDAMITINEKAIIKSVNKSTEKMFGYSEDELVGNNVKMLIPFPYNIHHDNYIRNYLKTGEKKIIDRRREIQGLKKDGTIFPIDLGVTEVVWEGNRIFTGVIRDLSSRRVLEQRLIEIGNEERRRIGRDLHDGLGQMLTGIRMLTENLARKLQANALPAAGEVQEIAEMLKEADQYTRTLSRGMVQIDIDKVGLNAAIQNLCKQTTKMTGTKCFITGDNEIEIENHTMAIHIYRIIQEAISNAVKHGKAGNITVRLSRNMYHTSVSIDDDGTGFDPAEKEIQGIGLQIMNYRAAMMGGVFEIIRTDEATTRVRCIIPNNMNQFKSIIKA